MISYQTYLKYGGKRDVTAFWELQDKYLQMRRCSLEIAYQKAYMRRCGIRESVKALADATWSLSHYCDCDGLQKLTLRGLRELSEMETNRILRQRLNDGRSVAYLI